MTNEADVAVLLEDTLALWHVRAVVTCGADALTIEAANGTLIWIERAEAGVTPFRWLLRWRRAGEAPGAPRERRPRGCASIVGVLAALRVALDVERGAALRIAPVNEATAGA